ncbi:transcriptional regulator containing an amidase domain and an AraC-type DNA-binding HTH domain [Opitutaceae bacterium TAV1]|nr:transcriptional regulator containing an amidase domain and an AraC-type DNA-binding HTH domain [Opitutaceae bacterium TAV1]
MKIPCDSNVSKPRPSSTHPELTSVDALGHYIPGRILSASTAPAWRELPARLYRQPPEQAAFAMPAVTEPHLVWIVSGSVLVEEREPGGTWSRTEARPGMFFLTVAGGPYELRWRVLDGGPFETLQVFLPLPVIRRAIGETRREEENNRVLRDASGFADPSLDALLRVVRSELELGRESRETVVASLAHVIAMQVVRRFAVTEVASRPPAGGGGLPGFKLRRCLDLMAADLARPLDLRTLTAHAGMSGCHFSRLFKRATGMSPSRHLLDLRMEHARRLLRETTRSIIRIGMESGYSNPSHFSQIFRRETGCSPRDYRRQR